MSDVTKILYVSYNKNLLNYHISQLCGDSGVITTETHTFEPITMHPDDVTNKMLREYKKIVMLYDVDKRNAWRICVMFYLYNRYNLRTIFCNIVILGIMNRTNNSSAIMKARKRFPCFKDTLFFVKYKSNYNVGVELFVK